jgi:hypothetical protein
MSHFPPLVLRFVTREGSLVTEVQDSPTRQTVQDAFAPPYDRESLSQLRARLRAYLPRSGSRPRLKPSPRTSAGTEPSGGGTARDLEGERPAPPADDLAKIGTDLFESLFAGKVGQLFERNLGLMQHKPKGGTPLQIRFQHDLADNPLTWLRGLLWESLRRQRQGIPLALDPRYSLVHSFPFDLDSRPRPGIDPPLEILIVKAAPSLDEQTEAAALTECFSNSPSVQVTTIEAATTEELGIAVKERKRQQRPVHVFHFIGHGRFDPAMGEGSVFFEGTRGARQEVRAKELVNLLASLKGLQLLVLNACETGEQSDVDPASGVAAALMAAGFPAVIAMQFPISDTAAIDFSRGLYDRLAAGDPVDVAMIEARRAILFRQPSSDEWVTPALFVRGRDTKLFAIPNRRPKRPVALEFEMRWRGADGPWREAVGTLMRLALGFPSRRKAADDRRRLIEAIAGWLHLAPSDLEIPVPATGTTRITVQLPVEAATQLLAAAQRASAGGERLFRPLGVVSIQRTTGKAPPVSWIPGAASAATTVSLNLLAAWPQVHPPIPDISWSPIAVLVTLAVEVFLCWRLFAGLRARLGRRGRIATLLACSTLAASLTLAATRPAPAGRCDQAKVSQVEIDLPAGPRRLELGDGLITEILGQELAGVHRLTGRAILDDAGADCPCTWSGRTDETATLAEIGVPGSCDFEIDLPTQFSRIFLRLQAGQEATNLFTVRVR